MPRAILDERDVVEIQGLLERLAAQYDGPEDPPFLDSAALLAHELPYRVRAELLRFRLEEPPEGVLVIGGYPVDDERIGPTPDHWKFRRDAERTKGPQMLLVLYASVLGEVMGWSTQQDGTIVHDVFPIKEHALEQLGSGSETLLTWHTEDAFHPYRADYLALFCLRNPARVPTTLATVDADALDPRHVDVLFEDRFTIRPDESHLEKNESDLRRRERANDPFAQRMYERINEMNERPPRIAVLFGGRESPYLRLDPYFMDPLVDDPEAQQALDALTALIDATTTDVVLAPGDCVFIDNYRAVHGRPAFKARFDGTDRWLKRVNIARDLRKSRDQRRSSTTRIVG